MADYLEKYNTRLSDLGPIIVLMLFSLRPTTIASHINIEEEVTEISINLTSFHQKICYAIYVHIHQSYLLWC